MDSEMLLMVILAIFTLSVAIPAIIMIHLRAEYREKVAAFKAALRRPSDGNEYRDVILKMYRRVREKAKWYLLGIESNQTARQLFCRVARELPVDRTALETLRTLYEKARYTDQELDKGHLKTAIEALRKIEHDFDELRIKLEQEGLPLEKAFGTEPLAKAARKLAEERHKGEPEPGFWVVAPESAAFSKSQEGQRPRSAPLYRDQDKEAVLREFGAMNMPPGPGLPDSAVDPIYKAIADRDLRRVGELILEQAGGAVRDRRVHVDPSLVSYLLEFERREQEAGNLPPAISKASRLKVLLASQVLVIAEGRDYLVPDDLKVALHGAGPMILGIDAGKIAYVLDEEKREIEFPAGPRIFQPYPVETRGMCVPVE